MRWFNVSFLVITLLSLPIAGISRADQARTPVDITIPETGDCVAPALPPGTPTPNTWADEPLPDPETASPEPAPAAETLLAEPRVPPSTPVDPATIERQIAGMANIVYCMNSGDHLAVAALFTPNFIRTYMGIENPYDVPAILAGMTMADARIHSVGVTDDGRIVVEDSYVANGHQLIYELSYLVEEDGYMKLDQLVPLPAPVPADAVLIDVELVDHEFQLSRATVPAGQAIVIRADNTGVEPHEIVLLELPPGGTVDDVIAGTISQEDVRLIGQVGALPGQSAEMVLVDLPPGTYTMFDFIPAADGLPHFMHGMTTTLIVE